MRRLVTLPKGKPKEMTSASVTSLGSLRTWITRDGTPALLSPLNFLMSFPLAGKTKVLPKTSELLTSSLRSPSSYCFLTEKFRSLIPLKSEDTWFYFTPSPPSKGHAASDVAECHCSRIKPPVAISQLVYSTHQPLYSV